MSSYIFNTENEKDDSLNEALNDLYELETEVRQISLRIAGAKNELNVAEADMVAILKKKERLEKKIKKIESAEIIPTGMINDDDDD
jgi:chromosome segregation ATPase